MRTAISQSQSIEEASGALLDFALQPQNWLTTGKQRVSPAYFRRVETVQILSLIHI